MATATIDKTTLRMKSLEFGQISEGEDKHGKFYLYSVELPASRLGKGPDLIACAFLARGMELSNDAVIADNISVGNRLGFKTDFTFEIIGYKFPDRDHLTERMLDNILGMAEGVQDEIKGIFKGENEKLKRN